MNVSIGGVERTTGCVSGGGTFELDIQPGMSQAVVEVLPNCEQTTGTAWVFEFECPLTSEVTADGTGRVLPGDDDDAGSGGAPGSGGQIGQGSVGGGLSGMPPVTTGAGAPPGPSAAPPARPAASCRPSQRCRHRTSSPTMIPRWQR